MSLRDGLLREYEALAASREKLLAIADQNKQTIIPAYTHGVQAQPTTFAHYLLAWESAVARNCERLQQAYQRINKSPLGPLRWVHRASRSTESGSAACWALMDSSRIP